VKQSDKLGDLARVIRSKDAGNFHLTFDVIFEDERIFARVVKGRVLNEFAIRQLYRLPPDSPVEINVFPPGLGIKVTILRPKPSGGVDGVGESDLFGSNQHMPLLDLIVPAAT
jgi:hypothetical protein